MIDNSTDADRDYLLDTQVAVSMTLWELVLLFRPAQLRNRSQK